MASHSYHKDNPDAIFFDDCPECDRQALEPVYHLDQFKMRKLWNRMLNVEVSDVGVYLSHNEAVACKTLWPIFIFMQRFTAYNPMTMKVGEPTL